MANQVFANNMEISCKAGSGKSICAFPDVCFTPPQTPATPPGVPIPYPNTGLSSDSSDGSSSVHVSGQEVMLKDKSAFKKSTGDEAGAAPKKGLISSKNTGKVYFKSWSMDVKIEGENVVRHLDLTTHNHGSEPANEAAPWPHIDDMVVPATTPQCEKGQDKLNDEADDLPDSKARIHEDAVTRGESPTIAGAYGGRTPPATTLAVGQIAGGPPGTPSTLPAHSRQQIGKKRNQRYAQGQKQPGQSGSTPCGSQPPHEYAQDQTHHRHAEAKIIEDWFGKCQGQGQLILNVSRPVCPNCAALIRKINCGPNGERCQKILVCANHQDADAQQRLKC